MVAAFKKTYTKNADVQKLQDNVANVLDPLVKNLFANSSLVKGVKFTASSVDTAVNHGLNVAPTGFLLTNSAADSRIWASSTKSPNPNQTIILCSSAAGTVDILFF